MINILLMDLMIINKDFLILVSKIFQKYIYSYLIEFHNLHSI